MDGGGRMVNLIVTAAGLSSRFEGLKPKWMLTHPSGNWMLHEALCQLDFESIDRVYFGFLGEHLEKYKCHEGIVQCLHELDIEMKSEIVILDERTDNQVSWMEVGWALHNIDPNNSKYLNLWLSTKVFND